MARYGPSPCLAWHERARPDRALRAAQARPYGPIFVPCRLKRHGPKAYWAGTRPACRGKGGGGETEKVKVVVASPL